MNNRLPDNISFGEWVRQRRHILDLTQQELADQVGCARITLRRIEAGTLKPSKELAQVLLEKLDAPEAEREAWLQFARGRSGFPGSSVAAFESQPITGLPTSLTSFIGRGKEQDEVIQLIAKNRLVTIAGVGGIGKTRLAQQVGQKLPNNFPNGVWFITLDSLSDPSLVASTVAAVFDIRQGSSDQPLIERLIYSLRKKTALLILDNCEHLLDACSQLIKTLLTNCPNLKVLVTSREILDMEGETIHYAPTLSLPEQDERTIQKILEHESIQLFRERATLALSSFRLTTDNIQPIVNICRRVDGIPLAIEMAAARVDILSVDEILRQLDHCFDLLVGKRRSTVPRHRTMRACMDWSWGLLTEPEQKFMRQLSIFAGGWTLDSAQAVYEGDALNFTGALVKKSLISVKQEAEGKTRYQFHEIVHQYAHEKLVESGEEANVRTQHLKYFLGLSELAEPALRGPAQIEWMSRVNDERDNIRAALAWADRTDVEAGLQISSRFVRFWESFDIREGSYWLSTFLKKPESQAYPRTRAMALYSHLPLLNYLNEVDTLRSTAKECLELCHDFGYQSIEVDILIMRAGEIPSAAQRMELFQQSLNLAQASGDIWRQARTLHQVGWNYGDEERLAYWERAITLFRHAGDWRELAQLLGTTGLFALLNDDLEFAQKCLDEATLLNGQLQDKETQAGLLHAQARIAMLRGNYNQARSYSQEELDITEELGARMSSLWCQSQIGYLALYEGNFTEAGNTFTKTVREFLNDKNEIGVVFNLEGIAGLYVAIGKPKIAARLIGWADIMRERINDRRPRLEQADVDKIITACLANMGEVAFSDAYEEGQKMTMDEAVAYALEEK